jgi:hypothetical protein
VLSGAWVGGMCMTEPATGTDVLGMKSQAVRRGDSYFLNGRKMFITNGALDDKTLGDIFLVYAKTDNGISSFVVEKGFPGFSLGQRLHGKTGMRARWAGGAHTEDSLSRWHNPHRDVAAGIHAATRRAGSPSALISHPLPWRARTAR